MYPAQREPGGKSPVSAVSSVPVLMRVRSVRSSTFPAPGAGTSTGSRATSRGAGKTVRNALSTAALPVQRTEQDAQDGQDASYVIRQAWSERWVRSHGGDSCLPVHALTNDV